MDILKNSGIIKDLLKGKSYADGLRNVEALLGYAKQSDAVQFYIRELAKKFALMDNILLLSFGLLLDYRSHRR